MVLAFSVFPRARPVTIRARAKVNLGLEVLGRRPDGYHELLTLLSAIDLADRVVLTPAADGIEVRCDAPGVPAGPANLAWRAADLVRRTAGVGAGVRIRLTKVIPVAAGLGGGSADAAAVLVGLSRMWRLGEAPERLHGLATELGMDVAFFLGEGPALAGGRGERLTALPRHRAVALVVVNPGFPLVTREVYGRLRPADFTDGARVRALVAAWGDGAPVVAARIVNGLEVAVAGLWPGLAEVKAALLEAGALGAVMSGSGPTVIGIAPSRAAAARIRERLSARPWRTWVTRTVAGPALSVAWGGRAGARQKSASHWGVAKR